MSARVEYLVEGNFSLRSLIPFGVTERDIENIEFSLSLPLGRRDDPLYFVGIIEVSDVLFVMLPKAYKDFCSSLSDTQTLLKLLSAVAQNRKVTSRIPDGDFLSQGGDVSQLSRFGIARFLLDDFVRNGHLLFANDREIVNANRQVDWGRTIDRILPIFSGSGPIYDRWVSKRKDFYTDDQIRRVHEYIICSCLHLYGGILGMDLSGTSFRSDELPQYAEKIISTKLRRVYTQRNIHVLKALKRWLQLDSQQTRLSFFGTRHFHVIWEEVCSFLFQNVKDHPEWAAVFPCPQWKNILSGDVAYGEAFRVDIISETDGYLLLADAKYYDVSENKNLPGIADISKQIHYESLLLSSGIFQQKYNSDKKKLLNLFLFPVQDKQRFTGMYEVSLERLTERSIYGVALDCTQAFNLYNSQERLSSSTLHDIIAAFGHGHHQ